MFPIKRFLILLFASLLAALSYTTNSVARMDEGIKTVDQDEKSGNKEMGLKGMGVKALKKILVPSGKTELSCPGVHLSEGSTDEAGRLEIIGSPGPECMILFSKKYSRTPVCVTSASDDALRVFIGEDYLAFGRQDGQDLSWSQAINYICRLPDQ